MAMAATTPAQRHTVRAMDTVDLPAFGPGDYERIVDGEPDPFDTHQLGMVWRPKTAHVGIIEDGRLVAHASWVPARVTASTGQVVDVLGLGSVIVHRDFRGSGIGHRLVAGAMERMRELGGPLGMLFCHPERLTFYERLGWGRIPGAVTVDQPTGVVAMPLASCWAPLAPGATWPAGDAHVEGLPF